VSVGAALILGAWWFFFRPPEEPPSAEALRVIACDRSQSVDARSEAIFRLFAGYVPPNASSATMRKVFRDCDWITEARIFHFFIGQTLRGRLGMENAFEVTTV
jgi:hypothetical protein